MDCFDRPAIVAHGPLRQLAIAANPFLVHGTIPSTVKLSLTTDNRRQPTALWPCTDPEFVVFTLPYLSIFYALFTKPTLSMFLDSLRRGTRLWFQPKYGKKS